MYPRDLPETIDRARLAVLGARGEGDLLVALDVYRKLVEIDVLRRLNDGMLVQAEAIAAGPPPDSVDALIAQVVESFYAEILRRLEAVEP